MNMHTTTETTPLAPCPFCGAPAHGYAIEPHSHSPSLMRLIPELPDHPGSYVIEGQCACGSGLIGADETEVVARWNRRTTAATPLAPTDAEIAALAVEINKTDWNDAMDALICFARAVLARWGQPAHSGEPVAWRYRMSGDMQWQYTERKEQFSHASEVEALTNMQPVEREPLTPREIELIDGMIAVQLDHAMRCDAIANRAMADKQKGWDMERVALLQKFKATHGSQGGQHGAE